MNARTVSLKDAKARLSELSERAAAGTDMVIVKHGQPVTRLTAAQRRRKPMDLAQLRTLTATMPRQPEGAGRALRRLRDRARC